VIAFGNDGTHVALKQDDNLAHVPGTPEHIRKYRKSFQNQPGLKQVHPGLINDAPPVADNYAYGKKTYGSDHVHTVMKAQNLAGLADKFNDIKENKYAS
jgi:hypothetical protein